MNCRGMDDALMAMRQNYPLTPQAEEHLKVCRRCRELVRELDLPVSAEAPSPVTLERVQQRMLADLRPVRPMAPRGYLVTAFVGVFVLMVAVAAYSMGAFALAAMSPLQAAVALAALAAGAGLVAQSLVLEMAPGSRHRVPPARLLLLVGLALVLMVAALFQFQPEPRFWTRSWRCLRAGGAIALLSAAPFWLLVRRGAMLSPVVTGAATGALAGLVGTTALQIHCPNLHAGHILISHVGVAVVFAAAGMVVGLAVEKSGVTSGDSRRR